jgi:rubrerythrin
MAKLWKISWITPVLLVAGLFLSSAGNPTFGREMVITSATLQNLQCAYNIESNAHNRYVAFAQKADEEGYGEVASLFRAAARSEEIQMRNHAEAILALGAEPRATIVAPVVLSTQRNLESLALKDRASERNTMYLMFIVQARAEGIEDAVRTFGYAHASGAQHFTLFTAALRDLQNMRGKSRTYYVCKTCGATSEDPGYDMCTVCLNHDEPHDPVN